MALTENEILNKVEPYLKQGKKSVIYLTALDEYNHLRFHIDGYQYNPNKVDNPYFSTLIEERRPNEGEDIKNYRKKIYLPKTKQPCFKVLNSIKKIVKSQDWKIDYSKAEDPNVVGKETLKQYCEKNYPIFNSLENWLYSYATKEIISDPNGIIYVEPKNWEVEKGEKWEPVAKIVKSPDVYAYKEGEFAMFKSDRTNSKLIDGQNYELPIYVVMTKDQIIYIVEDDLERNYHVEIKMVDLEQMYCLKTGGIYKAIVSGEALFGSFIDPMLPSLDAAAREVSDLDAEVVQHIYSTMWYYSGNDCNNCKGTGQINTQGAGFNVNKAGEPTACPKCDGNGRLLKSPYKDIVIGKDGLGESGIPTPPGGYIQKTVDIVQLQDERIKAHIFDALAALNMEFLSQVPLNTSGTAKEVDRDELNNYVYGIAYHMVQNILLPVYGLVNDMRYGVIVSNEDQRDAMLPSINVPEKFDLLSTNSLLDNFKKAKEASIDPSIIDEYEVDVINKFFNNQPDVRDKLLLIKELDPLRGKDSEEKSSLFFNRVITKEDYILSTYINVFVDQLVSEDQGFYDLDVEEQLEKLYELADKKEIDEVEEMKNDLNPAPNDPDPEPNPDE